MRILYLSRWFPFPADNGSKVRTSALLNALADGHEVDLISFADAPAADVDQAAAVAICNSIQVVPYAPFVPRSWQARVHYLSPQPRSVASTYVPAFASLVREAVAHRRPDVIVVGQIDMVPYAAAVEGIPHILEELELGGRLPSEGATGAGWSQRLSAWKLRTYVRAFLPRFAAVTVVSPQEAALLQHVAPEYAGRLLVVPNGVTLPAQTLPAQTLPGGPLDLQPDTLLYPGAVTYHANLDAVRYFADAILPQIRRARGGVRLRVTGRTEGITLSDLPPEIEFTGYLPSVGPLLKQSWAVVVPLRLGGGSRIKVLEALAHGTPVVATRKGVEGLELVDGRDVLIAEEAEAFAEATIRLLGDTDLRARLAANGRRAVTAYEWARIAPRLRALVEEVAAESHAAPTPSTRNVQEAIA